LTYRSIIRWGLAHALIICTISLLTPVEAQSQTNLLMPQKEKDCLWQILHSDQDPIECAFPLRPSGPDLEQMREISRNILKDAFCNVEVKLVRRFFDDAVKLKDHSIKVPPQPVHCQVETDKETYPISFHFAPEVQFKDGVAVTATPGMGKSRAYQRC
jgi:hypothetical protein